MTLDAPRIDLDTPQAKAAMLYMQHKGYPNLRPKAVEEVEGEYVWYFYFDIPEGELELEVEYEDGEWLSFVTGLEHTP